MTSYRHGSWAARKDKLGDEAEGKFEEYCARLGIKYERFGLNHSELNVAKLPRRIRYMPDYLTNGSLYEVIGCGRDQRLKIGVAKHNDLSWWSTIMDVSVYCWDRKNRQETTVTLAALEDLIDDLQVEIGSFPEGKAYWSIPTKVLDWDAVPEE